MQKVYADNMREVYREGDLVSSRSKFMVFGYIGWGLVAAVS